MKRLLVCAILLVTPAALRADDPAPERVKVFILAGQSNMEGKAKVSLMETQLKLPATRDLYKGLHKDGKWIERDDVWIKYLGEKGRLSVGYGRPKSIGPELGFGVVVGDHYRAPVLLIKTAWGGRSLYRDFRSPSAGLPPQKVLDRMLAERRKRDPKATAEDVRATFGTSYRIMLDEVRGALKDLKAFVPDYKGQGYDLAGFVWFQGWNDMISSEATAEYAANMAHFIRDVRKDLKAPKLPFIIGGMGVGGEKAEGGVKKFRAAQAATLDVKEFRGNVALVKTAPCWDTEADAIFKKGWRQNIEAWNRLGSDFPYHYLGSAKTMLCIGRRFGETMLEMRGDKKRPQP